MLIYLYAINKSFCILETEDKKFFNPVPHFSLLSTLQYFKYCNFVEARYRSEL